MSDKQVRYDGLGIVLLGLAALLVVGMALTGYITAPKPADDSSVQQSMAWASWAMVVVSVIGGLIGAISLFLIYRTLQAALRSAHAAEAAVAEARRIGTAQVRAYLNADTFWLRESTKGFEVEFTYYNSGQSPARAVTMLIHVNMHTRYGQDLKGVWNQGGVFADIPAGAKSNFRFEISALPRKIDEEFSCATMVTFEYDDVFGETHRDAAAADLQIEQGQNLDDRPMRARPPS